MDRWQCIQQCGACCRLDPELRQDALDALSPDQRELYLSMVGADGWCIHFNSGSRSCRIYDTRPDFCRVSNLSRLFGTDSLGSGSPSSDSPSSDSPGSDSEGADSLAIACCQQQIRSEYGGRGRVMKRFLRAIRRP